MTQVGRGTRDYVIAADAGGTHTRVACFALDGRLLGGAVGGGGNPRHQRDPAANVADATARALAAAGLDARDAAYLVAGLAGINRADSNQGDADASWADDYFRPPGMTCPRVLLNDAVVAHRGAFCGEPGVVAVAGTGSMILAIDERGVETESGQFGHYAGAARHVARSAIAMIVADESVAADAGLVAAVLAHERVQSVEALLRARARVLRGGAALERDAADGRLALLITAAAEASPIADRAVRRLAAKVALGIALVAPHAGPAPVRVVPIGGVATSPAFAARLGDELRLSGTATPAAPILDPVGGAALLALRRIGIVPDAALVRRLAAAAP